MLAPTRTYGLPSMGAGIAESREWFSTIAVLVEWMHGCVAWAEGGAFADGRNSGLPEAVGVADGWLFSRDWRRESIACMEESRDWIIEFGEWRGTLGWSGGAKLAETFLCFAGGAVLFFFARFLAGAEVPGKAGGTSRTGELPITPARTWSSKPGTGVMPWAFSTSEILADERSTTDHILCASPRQSECIGSMELSKERGRI